MTSRLVVALFSGGLDSTVMIAQLLARGVHVQPLFVAYGQPASGQEVRAVQSLAYFWQTQRRSVGLIYPPHIVNVSASSFTLKDTVQSTAEAAYVPGRNALLLSLGSSYAESVGSASVSIGVNRCEDDEPGGFADATPQFIQAYNAVLRVSTGERVKVLAPFARKTKREIVQLAEKLALPSRILRGTWSCYTSGPKPCGKCLACRTREDAILGAR